MNKKLRTSLITSALGGGIGYLTQHGYDQELELKNPDLTPEEIRNLSKKRKLKAIALGTTIGGLSGLGIQTLLDRRVEKFQKPKIKVADLIREQYTKEELERMKRKKDYNYATKYWESKYNLRDQPYGVGKDKPFVISGSMEDALIKVKKDIESGKIKPLKKSERITKVYSQERI